MAGQLVACWKTGQRIKALECFLSESLRFLDSHRLVFFTANTDPEEGIAFEYVERARDRTARPVGFLAEPLDDARLAQLLLALLFGFLGGLRLAGCGLVFFFLLLLRWLDRRGMQQQGREERRARG